MWLGQRYGARCWLKDRRAARGGEEVVALGARALEAQGHRSLRAGVRVLEPKRHRGTHMVDATAAPATAGGCAKGIGGLEVGKGNVCFAWLSLGTLGTP